MMTSAEFRRLRRLTGLTQEETARLLEVAHRTVLRWEHGESRIGPLRAQAIRMRLTSKLFSPADPELARASEEIAKPTYR